MLERGELQRIGRQILHPDTLGRLEDDIRSFFSRSDKMSPVDFKEMTGLSRKFAIPMLEWLDSRGITRRRDNFRIQG